MFIGHSDSLWHWFMRWNLGWGHWGGTEKLERREDMAHVAWASSTCRALVKYSTTSMAWALNYQSRCCLIPGPLIGIPLTSRIWVSGNWHLLTLSHWIHPIISGLLAKTKVREWEEAVKSIWRPRIQGVGLAIYLGREGLNNRAALDW